MASVQVRHQLKICDLDQLHRPISMYTWNERIVQYQAVLSVNEQAYRVWFWNWSVKSYLVIEVKYLSPFFRLAAILSAAKP